MLFSPPTATPVTCHQTAFLHYLKSSIKTKETSRHVSMKESYYKTASPFEVCFTRNLSVFFQHCVFTSTWCGVRQRGEFGHVSMTVPVYNIIGLFCADDTEGIDGSIGRCEVGVLSWSPGKAPRWALTASQKLTHTGERRSKRL